MSKFSDMAHKAEAFLKELLHPHAQPAAGPPPASSVLTRMYIAPDPEAYVKAGVLVGNGQCVALVRDATGAPQTPLWIEGPKVLDNPRVPAGAAIATFIDGKYPSHDKGNHAAIYLGPDPKGIKVIDQWVNSSRHPPQPRVIRRNNPHGAVVDQAEVYSVVLTAKVH